MKSAIETEVKVRLSNASAASAALARAGFSVSVARKFESNTLYDTRDGSLRRQDMMLRLRQIGDCAIVTWKGPSAPGRHKNRQELETSVGSVEIMGKVLEQLGYQAAFRYEKYRTEFTPKDGDGLITLDETPIGDFLELEGPGDWIDETAGRLGYSHKDYIVESYRRLYVNECARRGVEPLDMVFASRY